MSLPTLFNERYEVIELLGEGGMASVYRCRDLQGGAIRAIKVMDKSLAHRTEVLRRFEVEAEAMDRLDHPNIVPLHDVCFEGEERFIVMDFVDGESLHDRVSRAVMAPQEALAVLIPVLDALATAHENEIVHRDIKPHNILLSKGGGVFVSDFGIARCIVDTDMSLTRTGVIMGTWAFMAPEQRADSKGVDHLADIYSVGATLFSAVTGQTPKDLFAAELDPTIYEGVSPQVEAIIRRACAYWTTDRYRTASAMKKDLEDNLAAMKSGIHDRQEVKKVRLRQTEPDAEASAPRVPKADHGSNTPLPPHRRAQPPPHPLPSDRFEGSGLVVAGLAAVVLIGMLAWMWANTMESTKDVVQVVQRDIPEVPRKGRIEEQDEAPVSQAPQIQHEPVTAMVLGESLYIAAKITGSGAYDQVSAWYRPRGMSEWSRAGLRRVGDEYQGAIEITPLFSQGLEYWIEAKGYHDGVPLLSHGSAGRPIRVPLAMD